MRTTIANEGHGLRVTRDDGESIFLYDIGRCYVLSGPGEYQSVNVSHGIGGWSRFVKSARRWFRSGELPILDVHE